ncbi:MAG TPA: FAD-dependent oxidoreductase, partial [Ktedonobacteraceae bacterium]|nr:FAD-dependent oxidoreductase [Ktedonobacteraceae bacterium]
SPFLQLSLAGLHYYRDLDQHLKQETGVDIGLLKVPRLRLAFNEQDATALQALLVQQQQFLQGLEWIDGESARKIEPLLSPKVQGVLVSPYEYNVSAPRLTLAYARGALMQGVRIFTGRSVNSLLLQGPRIVGAETDQGQIYTEHVILAAGAWTARWHTKTALPVIFPVKGQMLALQAPLGLPLRHTLSYHKLSYLVPKADGSIYVGATSEHVGFSKTVNAAGIATLLNAVAEIAPRLLEGGFERTWTGLRPGSADGLPLLGASRSRPGLWLATGHFRDGILQGPLTGHILAELIQGQAAPFGLDLSAFDPDRFGGWGG